MPWLPLQYFLLNDYQILSSYPKYQKINHKHLKYIIIRLNSIDAYNSTIIL